MHRSSHCDALDKGGKLEQEHENYMVWLVKARIRWHSAKG